MLWRKLPDLPVEALAGVQDYSEGRPSVHEPVV